MKIRLSILAVIILGGSAGLWFIVRDRSIGLGDRLDGMNTLTQLKEKEQEKTLTQSSFLSVNDFMQNVDQHKGTVRIQGVVSATDPSQNLLALIDVKEFQACQTAVCAPLTLPVRWLNDMPDVAETVVISGSVQDLGGKRIFVASSLQQGISPER